MSQPKPHRGTIFAENAKVVRQIEYPGRQYILRVEAPKCAAAARAGTFAHITCDPALPMRRPLSIMRADRDAGWVEFLYKVVGGGLRHLSERRTGDTLDIIGPIGHPFEVQAHTRRPLLVGGGVGIPPMVFLADVLRFDGRADFEPLVLMGSEIPFPFDLQPSGIAVPGIPEDVTACMPLLEDWSIASRLASGTNFPGCFDGFVTGLAREWLASLTHEELAEVGMFACGPTPMLKAAAAVAREFGVPCQVSLEEFMACAVGGCAGCTVLVQTPEGPAMKRVCVDGPVFEANSVFPP